ncbi:bifunctional (p)ppGpp synthetase/guanosine-3',5'-bis(diphosphate) 3'-pyrophosphohydrolase [Candidatus Falkowbacteria bacterium]|nr:MAG: bifunctional (p)ppGpp synthetase/guanosine-3',5'-bis(diphosphate) 3'-pyrophosphohydrolase [Candidatus Falkowbacteria bacterium]
MTIEQIISQVENTHPKADLELVRRAYDFACQAHGDQMRKTGEPYIQHPLHTAFILAQIRSDIPTIIAGLLHDVPEDTSTTLQDIQKEFGEEVAHLVEGITKLSKIKYRGIARYRESLRKMFLAMAEDLRVILIKFADRLHNLRTLDALPPEKQKRITQETLEIYAPIAGLLGIWSMKWQMEDICFKYLYPEEYKQLEYRYEIEKKTELNQYIEKVKKIVTEKLNKEKIPHEISGRFKHLYSIWQKMQAKDRAFNEIYDVFALRIIVPTVADCYKALGIVHATWRPSYNRFKDYIAVPKPNGYRSIHTTVFGPDSQPTEFQIRTAEMQEESVYGISAHWYYKQLRGDEKEKMPKWVQEILEIQRKATSSRAFINEVKLHIFQDRIFVFTPRGDVHDLPSGATPVDFAYAVHSDIGNKCVSARINHSMGALDQKLKNGDMVEIITDQNRAGPNYDWLGFVKTRRAQEKIKQYSKQSRLGSLKRFFPGFNKK